MSWVTTVLGVVALATSVTLIWAAFAIRGLRLEISRGAQRLEWTEQSREQTWRYCDQLVDQLLEAERANAELGAGRDEEGEGECSTRP